jgi:putative tRNA adenosine deaminase-associated protein
VAYFAALLARYADEWQARDIDLDEVDDGVSLVEFIREACEDEEPDTALVLLEREDAWFALVRLDLDEDPRVFASDLAGVGRSGYADLLAASTLVPVAADGTPLEAAPVGEDAEEDENEQEGEGVGEDGIDLELGEEPEVELDEEEYSGPSTPSGPAGDAALLADFGQSAKGLVGLCDGRLSPADALAEIANRLGAAEELEAVR